MSVKKIRKFNLFLLYFGLFCFFTILITANFKSELLIYIQIIIGIISSSLSVILNFIFWRCPHCGERFEMRHGKMDKIDYCPYCSNKIE